MNDRLPVAATERPAPVVLRAHFASALPELAIPWQAQRWPALRLLWLDDGLAEALGWSPAWLRSPAGVALLGGQSLPPGARPVAQRYAGHQFGAWVPELGDGRALLLGEAELRDRGVVRTVDVALKGSGPTPLARSGDGRAVLGPMLREALVSAAMHALGIPTTRTLAVLATGETVWRDGVPRPGALLVRVAASHLRVGSLQWAAAQQAPALLRRLWWWAVQRHDPALAQTAPAAAGPAPDADRVQAWLQAVGVRQARLVAQWMAVGFIHGVMNTDNMTLSGETIDYGPCAFMEAFEAATVYSSIDLGGRYAWGNQPRIAQWNLARLAEAVLPLLHPEPDRAVAAATAAVQAFGPAYQRAWRAVMRAKLGLAGPAQPLASGPWDGLYGAGADADDAWAAQDDALIAAWLQALQAQQADWTLVHRRLADLAEACAAGVPWPTAAAQTLGPLLAQPEGLHDWLARWQARLALDGRPWAERAVALRSANPLVIARNLRVEEALHAAEQGDLGPAQALLAALTQPFAARSDDDPFVQPAPRAWAQRYVTFCGT
ncbi:MAG: YdiU family protein [Tepidimonas sp.]|nr:YdiU family protein [Tepidimonas sp.]